MAELKRWITGLAVLALAGAGAQIVWATATPGKGISSDFGVVTLNNIPAGKAYRLTARPVRVVNDGSSSVDLKFEPVVPGADEMVPGFEPIPDASWVGFAPDQFDRVGTGKSVSAVLTLSVPDKAEYAGMMYQVSLHLHTRNDRGPAVGLKPKLCFRVAEKGVEVSTQGSPEVPITVGPPEITGKTSYLAVPCEPLTVTNSSSETMRLELGLGVHPRGNEPLGGGRAGAMPVRPGYEAMPDDISLVCYPAILELKGHSTGTVDVIAQLPSDGRYAGRKFQGSLYSRVTFKGRPMNLVNRVILEVPGSSKGRALKPNQKLPASKLKAITNGGTSQK